MTSEDKFAGTYRKLFDTIERGVQQCSTDRLQTILEEKKDQLLLGLEAFTEPSTQARTKVKSSNTLKDEEKEFIYKLSDVFQLNEAQVVVLWEAFKKENDVSKVDCTDTMSRMLVFYYEDRISFLECIGSLQRIATNEDHPYASIAIDILTTFINDPNFIPRLISQFSKLTRASVPNAIHSYSGWSRIWAKQCLKEEKALLQILLLLNLTMSFKPAYTLSIIQEFEATRFGQLQTLGYLLDEEGIAMRQQVSYVCSLLAVSSFMSIDNMNQDDDDDALFKHPDVISKINLISLFMGQSNADSLYLLAWSYFLCQVEQQLGSVSSSSSSYKAVENVLSGQQTETTDVLVDRPDTCEEGQSKKQSRKISIKQTPNVYRVFLGRALGLNVFGVLGEIAQSPLCDLNDVNNFAYRFVLRQLLKAFMTISDPSYISYESYSQLAEAYAHVYRGQSELCDMFWDEDVRSPEQSSLLITARNRFPWDFNNFIDILAALAGSPENGEAAANVYDFISGITTLAVPVSKVDGLEEEASTDGATAMRIVRSITVVPAVNGLSGIQIPEGSIGRAISEQDRVFQFELSYSGWHLFTSILQQSISGTTTDLYTIQSDQLSGKDSDTVLSILNLIRRVIQHNHALGPTLVRHIEGMRVGDKEEEDTPLLISILCEFLNKCSTSSSSIPLMVGALDCLVALFPHYPQHIWAYLATSSIIPQVNSSESQIRQHISNAECTAGRYPFLLSFLDLVAALVEDTQRRGWKDPNRAHLTIIHQCLRYLMLDVLPSYSGWAYKQFSERLSIGSKILDIFIDVGNSFKQPAALEEVRHGLFEKYLYDGGVYYTSHLLDNITEGATVADSLYKCNYPAEAGRVETLTEKSFIFISQLLQYRLESIKKGDARKSSLLERLILERTKGTDCSDFLLQIAKYIDYRHNIKLAIQATRVISLLCKAVSHWESVPNFVKYLGSTEEAHGVIRSYLSVAKDQFQDELLLTSIWQLMTLLLETQPSLAILFLDCGDFIMPSPKSAVHRQIGGGSTPKKPEAAPPNTTDSAISAAIDLLGEWHNLNKTKPAVLSTTLEFLCTFWQTAFDHYAIVERTRTDMSLWGSLERILLCPSEANQVMADNDIIDNEAVVESEQNKNVRRICCLNLAKAFALRLLALEVHIIAGNGKNGSVADKLPAGLKSLLGKISDPATLNLIRQNAIDNCYNGGYIQELERTAQKLSTYSFNDLLYQGQSVYLGHYGPTDQIGHYGYAYLYDFPVIHDRVRYAFGTSDLSEDAYLVLKYDVNHFLSCICNVNFNGSISESQSMLLRAFKIFIETVSCQAGELIWSPKAPTSSFDFIMHLQKLASKEIRTDGTSLTFYSTLLQFIRNMTEDWTTQGRNHLVQSDPNARNQYAHQVFQLLAALSQLLERENFAVMNSIRDRTAIRFHRPLLESIMLCLDTLFTTTSVHSKDEFKNCVTQLLPLVCESFHVLVVKAGSYGASGSTVPEEAVESCIQDVTVTVSLLQSLIHPVYNINPDTWLATFTNHNTIPSLIHLFYGGVNLLVSEVEKQKTSYNVNITPYAETALYFLMYLASTPKAARLLVEQGLFNAFCNNGLTRCLQEGQLDVFIRFGDKTGPLLVERNPLHTVWCLMLGVTSNLLRTLPGDKTILDNAVNLARIYGAQIGKAFDIANEINTSASPPESLSSPLLDEIQQISLVFFGLTNNLNHFKSVPVELFESFKDCSLILLQRYSYYMSHPTHLRAQLCPVTNEERRLLNSSSQGTNKLMIKTWDAILTISHYIITCLVMQTSTDETLTLEDAKWPFGNTILAPELNSSERESASFGTLVEYISIGASKIKEWGDDASYPIQAMLDVIQDCSVLLTSQVALWVAKPGIKEEVRMEIASDNVKDIMDTLIKVEDLLREKGKKDASVEQKSRFELVKSMQVFLGHRFYDYES